MKDQAKRIAEFTENELIEELARRKNVQVNLDPEKWCHDCAHWKSTDKPSANPCTKGHAMQFQMPEFPDEGGGFYRHICVDRKDIPEFPGFPPLRSSGPSGVIKGAR